MRRARTLAVGLTSALVALSACGVAEQSRPDAATQVSARRATAVRVVAVGDIACAPGSAVTRTTCRQGATARLAERLSPRRVLALGDLQYQSGGLAAFRTAYDGSWGRLRSITHPVPGNHEYVTRGAAGYYTYFADRQPGPPGWYVRDLGTWRAYFLNSNCDKVDCSAEATWLARDLAAHPRRCSLVVTHHPRWSSGEHGSNRSVARFYRVAYDHHVELMLSGHDHHYERFVPKRPDGTRSARGVVQFVSGTGGKSFYPADHVVRGSAYRISHRFGVLQLSLGSGRYAWSWKGIGGATRDSGSRSCT
ncbi:metallophosphoesterase family protein [Nocardioides marmoribigeumensis]|uniref:Calcineurin-like phosphoesterase domain-containing protein n=1 Tax=Nocardioides marmoribigeumensis TaxID=433649 RepID=A0ABU2BZZ8_9ACTN|nr:metallophosphoesterase [Nocardioides marmoribigeumensis]MDR7363978.1 hypothetical protein [Nocardioides marmoribigeumensis]